MFEWLSSPLGNLALQGVYGFGQLITEEEARKGNEMVDTSIRAGLMGGRSTDPTFNEQFMGQFPGGLLGESDRFFNTMFRQGLPWRQGESARREQEAKFAGDYNLNQMWNAQQAASGRWGGIESGYAGDTRALADQWGALRGKAGSTGGAILGGWDDLRNRALAMHEGMGEQEGRDIRRSYSELGAKNEQDLATRGLGNSTILGTMRQGVKREETEDLGRLAERIRGERINLDTTLTGARLAEQARQQGIDLNLGQGALLMGANRSENATNLAMNRANIEGQWDVNRLNALNQNVTNQLATRQQGRADVQNFLENMAAQIYGSRTGIASRMLDHVAGITNTYPSEAAFMGASSQLGSYTGALDYQKAMEAQNSGGLFGLFGGGSGTATGGLLGAGAGLLGGAFIPGGSLILDPLIMGGLGAGLGSL